MGRFAREMRARPEPGAGAKARSLGEAVSASRGPPAGDNSPSLIACPAT